MRATLKRVTMARQQAQQRRSFSSSYMDSTYGLCTILDRRLGHVGAPRLSRRHVEEIKSFFVVVDIAVVSINSPGSRLGGSCNINFEDLSSIAILRRLCGGEAGVSQRDSWS
jgi:hypothetical protein